MTMNEGRKEIKGKRMKKGEGMDNEGEWKKAIQYKFETTAKYVSAWDLNLLT